MDTFEIQIAQFQEQISPVLLADLCSSRRLLLVKTAGREVEGITELVVALALRGPLNVIAGGEWLPGYALTRAVRRRTLEVKQTLGRVQLTRPFTCYQVLDLLDATRPGDAPILILDFLHHFHNEDVDLPVRLRVFEQCCKHVQRLALFRPVLVFARDAPAQEYEHMVARLAAIADEVLQVDRTTTIDAHQPALFQV